MGGGGGCVSRKNERGNGVQVREVAVGTTIAGRPPRRSVRALSSAYGSYLGWWRRSVPLPSAHSPTPVTCLPRSVSGACEVDECSPRSAAFPPHSPPTVSRLCSNDSSVLCRCPTPQGRACGPCGLSLLPPSCGLVCRRRLRGLPVLGRVG